jgi:arylsulfatase A-like enzyme/tetratricopeptide (TPR) repeat protein
MPRRPTPAQIRLKKYRRTGLRALGVLLAAVVIWWWARGPLFRLEPREDRNILLVTIDTLRADALGSYGSRAVTPNLDRLAARGVKFTFAHAHAVVTLPSHASILTGRYPYEHGIRDNSGYRLAATEPSAATRMKQLGFATGAFIGGFPLDQRFGLNRGFDVYDDQVGEIGKGDDLMMPDRPADVVIRSALDWIGKQRGKWFAWVHLFDPHAPYRPPASWNNPLPNDLYLAEVSWTDFALGTLFDEVAKQPLPTLVVATSDHGEGLGEHGELTHGLFAYESTLRVPLILSEIGPTGRRPPRGMTIDNSVRHVDVLPTLLHAAGASPEGGMSGASLVALIGGSRISDRPSYFEAMTANVTRGWAPLRGVMVNREKYIDVPIPELYDLASDPLEQRNVQSVQRDRRLVLVSILRTFDVSDPSRPQGETREVLERLRALGYTGGNAAPRRRYTEEDDPKRLVKIEQSLHKAKEAYDQNRKPEAIELYKEIIATRPDTADAYRHLAFLYWQAGQPTDAIATLEAALNQGVTQADIRIKLGQYLSEVGHPNKAVALLEGSVADDPDWLIALGTAYAGAGRRAESMQTFRRILDIDPTSGLAHQNIGTLQLQARDFGAAEKSLRRALEIDPGLSGAHTALGVVLSETARKDAAIEEWKIAVRDGRDLDALFNLTVELSAAGRANEARVYGEQFLSRAPAELRRDDLARVRKLLDIDKPRQPPR